MNGPLSKDHMHDFQTEHASLAASCLWSPMWYDGMLIPNCPFTVVDERPPDTNIEYALLSSVHKPNTLLSRSELSVAMPVHSLIGTKLADEVQNCLPRFHFEVPHHPLKLLIYDAEDSEISSRTSMGAWKQQPISRSDLPNGTQVIGTMMVYKAKADKHGMLSKIKARLVLLGNQQKSLGLTRADAYSPVMKAVTLRIFLTLY